jgi:DNA replication protein DnaC
MTLAQPTTTRQVQAIRPSCKRRRRRTVAGRCARLAAQARRERQPHRGYLAALRAAEPDERERHAIPRRIRDAQLPRLKPLDEFDSNQAPLLSPPRIRALAVGDSLERAEPVVCIGDCGPGKTHLLTGLCPAACRQTRRVRFPTAAALVNERVEAKPRSQLRRVLARWARSAPLAIDEVGYGPLADLGAEFRCRIIADRAERAAVSRTTNLPCSEWTQVIPNPRLGQARLDRIADRAHRSATGTDPYRFRRTLARRQGQAAEPADGGERPGSR